MAPTTETQVVTNQIPSNFKTKQIDQSESIIFFQNGDRFFWHRGRLCLAFNSAVDLNIGFQHYSSRRCSFLTQYFYYKKKLIRNIGFEKKVSDPMICYQKFDTPGFSVSNKFDIPGVFLETASAIQS